jgi:hypothetical protein
MDTQPPTSGACEDDEAPQRVARLRELGLGEHPEAELDEFARSMAIAAGIPLAMVNFIGEDRQYLPGLHAPALAQAGPGPRQARATPRASWARTSAGAGASGRCSATRSASPSSRATSPPTHRPDPVDYPSGRGDH